MAPRKPQSRAARARTAKRDSAAAAAAAAAAEVEAVEAVEAAEAAEAEAEAEAEAADAADPDDASAGDAAADDAASSPHSASPVPRRAAASRVAGLAAVARAALRTYPYRLLSGSHSGFDEERNTRVRYRAGDTIPLTHAAASSPVFRDRIEPLAGSPAPAPRAPSISPPSSNEPPPPKIDSNWVVLLDEPSSIVLELIDDLDDAEVVDGLLYAEEHGRQRGVVVKRLRERSAKFAAAALETVDS